MAGDEKAKMAAYELTLAICQIDQKEFKAQKNLIIVISNAIKALPKGDDVEKEERKQFRDLLLKQILVLTNKEHVLILVKLFFDIFVPDHTVDKNNKNLKGFVGLHGFIIINTLQSELSKKFLQFDKEKKGNLIYSPIEDFLSAQKNFNEMMLEIYNYNKNKIMKSPLFELKKNNFECKLSELWQVMVTNITKADNGKKVRDDLFSQILALNDKEKQFDLFSSFCKIFTPPVVKTKEDVLGTTTINTFLIYHRTVLKNKAEAKLNEKLCSLALNEVTDEVFDMLLDYFNSSFKNFLKMMSELRPRDDNFDEEVMERTVSDDWKKMVGNVADKLSANISADLRLFFIICNLLAMSEPSNPNGYDTVGFKLKVLLKIKSALLNKANYIVESQSPYSFFESTLRIMPEINERLDCLRIIREIEKKEEPDIASPEHKIDIFIDESIDPIVAYPLEKSNIEIVVELCSLINNEETTYGKNILTRKVKPDLLKRVVKVFKDSHLQFWRRSHHLHWTLSERLSSWQHDLTYAVRHVNDMYSCSNDHVNAILLWAIFEAISQIEQKETEKKALHAEINQKEDSSILNEKSNDEEILNEIVIIENKEDVASNINNEKHLMRAFADYLKDAIINDVEIKLDQLRFDVLDKTIKNMENQLNRSPQKLAEGSQKKSASEPITEVRSLTKNLIANKNEAQNYLEISDIPFNLKEAARLHNKDIERRNTERKAPVAGMFSVVENVIGVVTDIVLTIVPGRDNKQSKKRSNESRKQQLENKYGIGNIGL